MGQLPGKTGSRERARKEESEMHVIERLGLLPDRMLLRNGLLKCNIVFAFLDVSVGEAFPL